MENTNKNNLSFPQRNWLLLCILVAIISPLVVHYVGVAARQGSYQQTIDIKPPKTAGDSSYTVASPPANDTGNKTGGKPPDSLHH